MIVFRIVCLVSAVDQRGPRRVLLLITPCPLIWTSLWTDIVTSPTGISDAPLIRSTTKPAHLQIHVKQRIHCRIVLPVRGPDPALKKLSASSITSARSRSALPDRPTACFPAERAQVCGRADIHGGWYGLIVQLLERGPGGR